MADTVIQPVRVGGSRPELQPGNPSTASSSILPNISGTFASDDGQSAGAKVEDDNFGAFPEPLRGVAQRAAAGAGTQVR